MWTAEDRPVDRLLIEQLTELLGKESIAGGGGGKGSHSERKNVIFFYPENGSVKFCLSSLSSNPSSSVSLRFPVKKENNMVLLLKVSSIYPYSLINPERKRILPIVLAVCQIQQW
jgi:hypothetical protein